MMLERGRQNFYFLLFFVSGFTSLVYETLWIRFFSVVYGSTTLSISSVLAVFFLGLAGGSWLGARWQGGNRQAARTYAWLEAGIGLFGLILVFAIPAWPDLVATILSPSLSSTPWLWLKLFSTFLFLIGPTLAMGMTFPLMVQLAPKSSTFSQVATPYALNTLGGALGTLATGFVLIPFLGTLWSSLLTVSLSLLISLSLFRLSKSEGKASPIRFKFLKSPITYKQAVYLMSSFVIGFVAIGAEVAWSKYLNIFLGTNIWGTSLVLFLFLFGLGLGSQVLSGFKSKFDLDLLFFSLLALTLPATFMASFFISQAPLWTPPVAATLAISPLLAKAIVVFAILVFPTALFGALLPLTVSILQKQSLTQAHWSGRVYTWNTLGGLLGALVVGLLAIPEWGTGLTLTYLGIGLFLILLCHFTHLLNRNIWIFQGTLTLCLVGASVILFPKPRFTELVKLAEFNYSNPSATRQEIEDYLDRTEGDLRFLAEGVNAVVSLQYQVDENGELNNQKLILKSSGFGESFFDLQNPEVVPRYESLLAIIPYLYAKKLDRAFVIGYGGGYTAEILSSLGLNQVVVSEIEENIVKASEYAYLGANPLLSRPNIKIQYEEARFLLTFAKEHSFDMILSQPSHSWMTGASHLFTQDFFKIAKSKLTEEGVHVQWVNLYNMNGKTLQSLLATFFSVYPEGAVFTKPEDQQMILLGSQTPLQLNYKRLSELVHDDFWPERLVHVPMSSEIDFLGNFAMDREKALYLAGTPTLNTDRRPVAEIWQSQLFYQDAEEPVLEKFFSPQVDKAKKGL